VTTLSANRSLGTRDPAWLIFGFFPFVLSGFLALVFHRPKLALAPLFGFCPFDLLQLTARETLMWSCVSGSLFLGLAAYSFFRRRLGIVFLILTWLSTAVLVLRLWSDFAVPSG
jgi:hypothetical protein